MAFLKACLIENGKMPHHQKTAPMGIGGLSASVWETVPHLENKKKPPTGKAQPGAIETAQESRLRITDLS